MAGGSARPKFRFYKPLQEPARPDGAEPMATNLLAKSSITIDAPAKAVWNALVDPQAITQYMFGAQVITDWKPGSPIVWKGEWQGKRFEDKGEILEVEPEELLEYSHYSPLSGAPDLPENRHTVTFYLTSDGEHTRVDLNQDKNASEKERAHSQSNWDTVLAGLKEYVEEHATRRSGAAAS
jgi:uncharacterized protein YndB with AHSA1/START domain